MHSTLQFLITIMFIISIPSFLIVFVLIAATKLSNPMDNSISEFWKFKIGRIALVNLITSVAGIILFSFLLNKMGREFVRSELNSPVNRIYINSEIVTNDSLLKDLRNFSRESELRNTGKPEIQLAIKNHPLKQYGLNY